MLALLFIFNILVFTVNSQSLIENYSNITRAGNLLNFFNIDKIASKWSAIDGDISVKCASEMRDYFSGLQSGELWALKMDDASGGYPNTGFFWGNNYWTGSMTLCQNIYDKSNNQNPPFIPRFAKLKFNFKDLKLAPTPRTIHIGTCLPSSCNERDIFIISTSSQDNYAHVNLIDVKIPNSNGYTLWSDSTFQMIFLFTVIICSITACATFYDIKLRNKAALHVTNEDKRTTYQQLLLSFSAISNYASICNGAIGEEAVSCLHGLRTICMFCVILAHSCLDSLDYSDNPEFRNVFERTGYSKALTKGTNIVDAFFFISGFLLSLIYLRTTVNRKSSSGVLQLIILVAYRFLRLTIPYAYVLGILVVTRRYFESTSVFDPPFADHFNCPKYWWRNIFYVNSWFPHKEMCMTWSWYLSNDTQFYIIGLIILIASVKNFKLAAAIFLTFLSSSWIVTGLISYENNHRPTTDDSFSFLDEIYIKPWTRLGPYLIGMIAGWILFKTNGKIKFSKIQLTIGWTLSIGTLFILLCGLFKTELSQLTSALFSAFNHSVWAIALSFIVIACATNNGGYFNNFLSASFFIPLSRLTYCTYLVHSIITQTFVISNDAPVHLAVIPVITVFFGHAVASYMFAFVISLLFEAPFIKILKVLVNQQRI